MKLTTADKVLERMNLSGTIASSNTSTIDSSLEAATPLIESILRTSLKATTRKDYFDYSLCNYCSFKPFVLWLSQGFTDSKVKIYFSADENQADTATATLLEAKDYRLDTDRGKVTILKQPMSGYGTIMVKYAAGFKDNSSKIPEWMREAAISTAVFINHTQSIAHGKKDTVSMTKPLSGIIYSIVNEYIITPYDGLYPSVTTV